LTVIYTHHFVHPDEERIDQVEVNPIAEMNIYFLFRPFVQRAFENTAKERHRTFPPSELYPNERLAPNADKTLAEFPGVSPIVPPRAKSAPINSNHTSASNGPATVATAIASSARSGDSSSLTTTATAHACGDAHMASCGVTPAIALPATPRSAPS